MGLQPRTERNAGFGGTAGFPPDLTVYVERADALDPEHCPGWSTLLVSLSVSHLALDGLSGLRLGVEPLAAESVAKYKASDYSDTTVTKLENTCNIS